MLLSLLFVGCMRERIYVLDDEKGPHTQMTDDHVFMWETSKNYTTDAARCSCNWFLWSPSREEMISAHAAHRVFVQQSRLHRRAELIAAEMNLHEIIFNNEKDMARCKADGCGWAMAHTSVARLINCHEAHRASEGERKYH